MALPGHRVEKPFLGEANTGSSRARGQAVGEGQTGMITPSPHEAARPHISATSGFSITRAHQVPPSFRPL